MPTLDEVLTLVARVSALTGLIAGEEPREVPALPRALGDLRQVSEHARCDTSPARERLCPRGDDSDPATYFLAFSEFAASDEKMRAERLIG